MTDYGTGKASPPSCPSTGGAKPARLMLLTRRRVGTKSRRRFAEIAFQSINHGGNRLDRVHAVETLARSPGLDPTLVGIFRGIFARRFAGECIRIYAAG